MAQATLQLSDHVYWPYVYNTAAQLQGDSTARSMCTGRAVFLEFALKAILYQPITKAEAAAKQQAVTLPPNPLRGDRLPVQTERTERLSTVIWQSVLSACCISKRFIHAVSDCSTQASTYVAIV